MIGIFLIYFIGRAFYELAHEFDKSRWGFAILGVVSYYAGTFIGGLMLGLLIEFGLLSSLENIPDMVLSLLTLPAGVLACWGFYKILQSQWSKAPRVDSSEVLDQDLMN